MKKKVDLSLYKSLVNSDFFLVSRPHFLKNLNSGIDFSGNGFLLLDIFYLIKEIKQFIRLLRFLSKIPKSQLIILLKNKHLMFLIDHYFNIYKQGFDIITKKSYSVEINEPGVLKMIISDSKIMNQKIEKNLEYHKFFLVNIMDLKEFATNFSFYNIQNVLDTNKKLYFILSLLELVLNRK